MAAFEFRIPRREHSRHWRPPAHLPIPYKSFMISNNVLSPTQHMPIPLASTCNRIFTCRSTINSQHCLIRVAADSPDYRFIYRYFWQDGFELFDYHTATLRHSQIPLRVTSHRGLTHWQNIFNVQLDERRIWRETWLPSRSNAENCFLWQMLYRTPATQHWRFPELPASDPVTWCTRCDLDLQEDILHCIWSCPISRQVWGWAQGLVQLSSPMASSLVLHPAHIIVALELPIQMQIPEYLWALIRPIVAWQIWKNRCSHYIEHKETTAAEVIYKAWH